MRTNFISMFTTWKNVMIRPGEQAFAAERSKASATLRTALVWILLAGLVAALLDILLAALTEMWVLPPNEVDFSQATSFPVMVFQPIMNLRMNYFFLFQEFVELYGWLWLHSGLFGLAGNFVYHSVYNIATEIPRWQWTLARGLLSPGSFLVKVGVYYCIATLFGGTGQFGRYAYLLAAIAVPFTFLNSLLDIMPLAVARLVAVLPHSSFMAGQNWYYSLLGTATFAASLIVLAYWLVLFYFSTKVEHGMTWWRAVISVVTSYLVVFVLRTVWPYGFMGILEAGRMLRW